MQVKELLKKLHCMTDDGDYENLSIALCKVEHLKGASQVYVTTWEGENIPDCKNATLVTNIAKLSKRIIGLSDKACVGINVAKSVDNVTPVPLTAVNVAPIS